MIRTVIIEDEKLVADYLIDSLKEIEWEVEIVARLETVQDSVRFLTSGEKIDLIFCDIQLRDGLSFSIFEAVKLNVPIVFVTAHNAFVLQALRENSIEYLLKPVLKEDLQRALSKYRALELHFAASLPKERIREMIAPALQRTRTRILAKKGVEHIALLLSDIVFFFTENKIVFAVDTQGKRYIVDKSITELETELDPHQFFRANRQYLVNISYIKSYKPYERVKLWVELTLSHLEYSIVISQLTASNFRNWLENS